MTDGKRAAKVGHKKSRAGCLVCRSRRVKCDEQSPVCSNCSRLGLTCEYTRTPHSPSDTPPAVSPDARLQRAQLRLLHAFTARALAPRVLKADASTQEWIQQWFVELPRLAMDHDNLLYALLAFSATQVVASSPDLAFAQLEFWSTALQEQRNAIARPDHHLEAAVLAGYLITLTSFGMLRTRDLSPYTPPLDWFELAHGAFNVCPPLENIPSESRILYATVEMTSPLWQPVSTVDVELQPILDYMPDEDTSAYEQALGAVSRFRQSVINQEPPPWHQRWICVLPQLVPARFLVLLREQRPRALLIMLCFWVALSNTNPWLLQTFGDTDRVLPRREIGALMAVLPSSWHELATQRLAEMS